MRRATGRAVWFPGLAALTILTGCDRNVLDEAPEEVRGTWVTDAPAYENRAFTIDAGQITIERGEAGPVTHRFERIEYQEIGAVVQYRFHHRNEWGEQDVFQVDHMEFPGDILRIKNQPRIAWYRDTIAVAGP